MRWIAAFVLVMVVSVCPASAKDRQKAKKTGSTVDQIIEQVESVKLNALEDSQQKARRHERVEKLLSDFEQQGQLTAAQKQKILDAVDGKANAPGDLPPGMDLDWKKVLKVSEFCRTTAGKILTDHLDEKDLKALLKFLKTPTGVKLIKEAPDMGCEAAELTLARFAPPLMEMGKRFRMNPHGLTPPGFQVSPEEEQKRKEMIDKLKEMLKQRQREREPHDET